MMICDHVVNGVYIEYDDVHIESWDTDMSKDWQAETKGILKAELKRRNISYRELAERLSTLGIHETERNIANKIARGGFTAVFLVQVCEAIGCQTLRLGDG